MNDNEIRDDSNQRNTYRATSNLNTAIENPQININSAVGVNIKSVDSVNVIDDANFSNFENNDSFHSFQDNQSFDVNSNSSFQKVQTDLREQNLLSNGSFGTEQNNSHFMPTDSKSNVGSSVEESSKVNSEYVATSFDEQVNYEPAIQEKKKHGVSFKITREFKVMLFIVFILFVFILIVPYIYDFFKDIQLGLAAR